MLYATLDEVKSGLRITEDDADGHLTILLNAASARVRQHLGSRAPDLEALASGSGSGASQQANEDAYDTCKAATILLVGLMDQAGVADDTGFDDRRMPKMIAAILAPLRKPPLA